jgi:uncharacterized membrane protein YeaQ/YmgE (transglycosylase-associated protein family)
MPAETLLIILLIGAIAGWLAGKIVQGTGFGLVADIAIGIVGAFIGNWLLPRLGLRVGVGLAAEIVTATVGAIVLLLILGLFSRGGFHRGGGGGGGRIPLTPPGFPIFLLSVALALLAVLINYAGVRLSLGTIRPFEILLLGYIALLAGVVFRGL